MLLAGLLPDMTSFVEALLPVHPVLAARCLAESGGTLPTDTTVNEVQEALVEMAISRTAPAEQRTAAGNALNYVGDPRQGVGLRSGVPDIAWCSVPTSEFLMGNTKDTDRMAYEWEMPQHVVRLAAFAIANYPITNAQYRAFVDDGGCTEKRQSC